MGNTGRRARTAFWASLALAGCPEPEVPVHGDKPLDAGSPADCKAACDRMRALKCPEGQPDDEGNTCETVCEHVESSGTVTLDPVCVTKIKSCTDIDRCSY